MSRRPLRGASRRWNAPEVVQTSSMDCGPAALKCLLEGHGVSVSYGRLREACQTDVDGTSIDTLETIANRLGLDAEQVLIPLDHLLLEESSALPALVVVRQADGATHFVIVWRRWRGWLQVMDPAAGRHWVRASSFLDEIFRHEMSVPSREWRQWAGSDEFLTPLRGRLQALGISPRAAGLLIDDALAVPHWFAIAALDACVRLVASLRDGRGVDRGEAALRLVAALYRQTCDSPDDIFRQVPLAYWSVLPDPAGLHVGEARLLLRGVVLLRVSGRHALAAEDVTEPLSPELAAALVEPPTRPLALVWRLLRSDGLLAPMLLAGAVVVSAAAVLLEALLFRGLFDVSWLLNRPDQRMLAISALIGFVMLMTLIELPIASETLRLGRHLELRLRMALLTRLPVLGDRYFHSRPISDMAERSHAIHQARGVPALGVQTLQAMLELVLTLAGIAWIAPASLPWAVGLAACAIVLPLALQPLLNERDMRLRSHAGALLGFHLDALQGLVPIRTHRAERAVTREHEGLLLEWMRAGRALLRTSTLAEAMQSLACVSLAVALLVDHLARAGSVTGTELLLVYWTLKLPAIGDHLCLLAHRYPAQRNMLLRLVEPLHAPTETDGVAQPAADGDGAATADIAADAGAAAFRIDGGSVVAGGHRILDEVDLAVAPGEHVAIVGVSGAGKSSLIGLLLGWHRLSSGRLLVDGEPLTADRLAGLRRGTAWVDPAVQLWNAPLADNLAYACDDDALGRLGGAIDAADLRRVLQKLPQGLQTHLGEGGALLSGGEGQRVRLARTLLQRDVRLVLLDEPFRGLDRTQRAMLMADARRWWRRATLLAVTHDVGETVGFDRVLVVEDGRLIEDGPPSALAGTDSRYRALLKAEQRVQAQWQRGGWRRLWLEDGRLVERDQAHRAPLAPVPRAVNE